MPLHPVRRPAPSPAPVPPAQASRRSLRAWSRYLGLVLCTGLALLGAGLASAAPVKPAPGLVADGIPEFESQVGAGSRRALTSARFLDWHPLRAEMLVLSARGGSQQLHLLKAAGGKLEPLTQGRDGVGRALWEPEKGDYLVFSRDQGGNEAFQLYALRPGNSPRPVSPNGQRVSDFEFLPGGEGRPQGLVYLQEQLDRQLREGDERVSHSRLVWTDPEHPEQARVLAEVRGGRFTGLRVGPSGQVVVLRTQGGRGQLLRCGTAAGSCQPLGSAQAAERPPASDPDVADGEDEELLWQRQAQQGEFRHLMSQGLDSATRRAWLADVPADLESVAVPPLPGDTRPLALVHNEQGISVLRLWQPGQTASLAPRPLERVLPPGVIRAVQWHPRLPLLAVDQASASSPGRIVVYDHERQQVASWAGQQDEFDAAEYATLRWKSFDGLEITGLHLAPPALRFPGPRPVYISIHGGPSSQSRPGYLSPTLYALVNQLGMHVILPNVRGSDGFGKKFLGLDNGRQRENAVKDISALLDLIATRPEMDAAKVVVAGGSYGGYMSLAVATLESDRIAGSFCSVGIANFVTLLERTESYRRDNRRLEYGDERDPAMRRFLESISPLNRAERVKKPLFIVHGRNDPRVPYSEAQSMVAAVRAHGTPVWFLTGEEEGHGFKQSANSEYLRQATLEFVRRIIRGEPVQAPSTQPQAADAVKDNTATGG